MLPRDKIKKVGELYNTVLRLFESIGGGVTLTIMVATTLLATIGGLLTLVLLPAQHFVGGGPLVRRHPAARVALAVSRNVIGSLLLMMGMVMVVPLVPGPGLVFILLGLSLVTFPGKKAFELRLLRVPSVNAFISRLRARFGREPFVLP